jgi:hypothetical protein
MLETVKAFISSNEFTMMGPSRAPPRQSHIYCYHFFSNNDSKNDNVIFCTLHFLCENSTYSSTTNLSRREKMKRMAFVPSTMYGMKEEETANAIFTIMLCGRLSNGY